MRRATIVSLAALAAAFVSLLLAGPSAAITRAQAEETAEAQLRPASLGGDLILFGLPQPVASAAVVNDAGPTARVLKAKGKAAWLFWLDLAPGAMYEHPSMVLVVDDATGRVALRRTLGYYPEINGRPAPFVRSYAAYYSPAYHVFSSVEAASATRVSALARPLGAPATSFPGDCLLLVALSPAKDWEGEDGTGGMNAWKGVADSLGIAAYVASAAGPAFVPSGTPVPGAQPFSMQVDDKSLARNVAELVDEENCKDILVYVLGHGTPPPGFKDPRTGKPVQGGPPGITLGLKTVTKTVNNQKKTRKIAKKLTPGGLEQIAKQQLGKASFKFVIEACFAERVKPDLIDELNVEIVLGSSAANEVTYGSKLPKKYEGEKPLVPNAGAPQFTHGLTQGVHSVAMNGSLLAELVQQGHGLARLLDRGFGVEKENDLAAKIGLTHPVAMNNLPSSPPAFAIVDLSHYHPPGSDTSNICGTIKGTPGAAVIVRLVFVATGQTADSQPRVIPSGGMFAFNATINTPGAYRVEVVLDGAAVASQPYTVPDPPTQGPRPCG